MKDTATPEPIGKQARSTSFSPFAGAGRFVPQPSARAGLSTVQVTDLRAADLYEVPNDLPRFDPRRNFIWQPKIAADPAKLEQALVRSRKARIGRQEPGYGPLDLAYFDGAASAMAQLDFGVNVPDLGGNAWNPQPWAWRYAEVPPPAQRETPVELDPAEAAAAVKKAALLYGSDLAGVAPLDRRWVYSHYYDPADRAFYPIRFADEGGPESAGVTRPTRLQDGTRVLPVGVRWAVVVAVEQDLEGIRSAPTLRQQSATLVGYAQVQLVALMVANFIRSLGWSAIPSSNCTALTIPLAIDAGLGQLGRNAKLITPRFGPRVRLAKVLTDLPLQPDRCIQFGLPDFCERCRRCATECPAEAIPFGERSRVPKGEFAHAGVLQFQVDHQRCYRYWSEAGTNCGICLAVCPYNKGMDWVRGVASSLEEPCSNQLDRVFGYGRTTELDRFWRE